MKGILWFIWSVTYFKECIAQYYWVQPLKRPSEMERYHYPSAYEPSPYTQYVNGTQTAIPDTRYTPDFRLEEPPFVADNNPNIETDRPYRLSPHKKAIYFWPTKEKPQNFGCYCVTVYKRLIPLAGCMVITTKHILTTATSTEVILRNYRGEPKLENILGAWYDTDANIYNSSLYMTPSRIHHHPKYLRDYEVNVSHPIPCMYDLSLWSATFRFHGYFLSISGAVICQRGVSSKSQYMDPAPKVGDLHTIVGFQYIKAYNRRPMPWFKYGIKVVGNRHENPCPKTEWGWFICFRAYYLKYGIDSGAGLHFHDRGRTWRIDGAVGMGAFSLYLRAKFIVHYFTVLDTYPVLNFIYDAEMGLYQEEFLDYRFINTKYRAPVLYWGEWVDDEINFGKDYCDYWPPNYRRRR